MSDSVATTDEIKRSIREVGLRATPARVATLFLLREATSPLTHSFVANHLASCGVDKVTAFRNLNDMTDAGLLRRTELGDHLWRFEAVAPGGHDQCRHHHFLCVDCGAISCLAEVKLTANSKRQNEAVGHVTEILLRGHCNACR